MPRAQERKRRAAAFTFQAAAPGVIPAPRGETGKPLRIAQMCNHYTIKIPGQESFYKKIPCLRGINSPEILNFLYTALFKVSWIRQ